MRPIQATISLSALEHNLAVAKSKAPQSKIMAVVKANGYGHGLLNAAKGLKAADGFAILGLDEALKLRNAGYTQTILMLEGVFSSDELIHVSEKAISIVVHSDVQINMLEQVKLAKPISVHLKINTGMNRLGFKPSDFESARARLEACNNVADLTLMTHFATADESVGITEPLAVFNKTTQDHQEPCSLANSATLMRFPEAHGQWVRAGIMLYGSSPIAGESAASFNLKPVMQFTSKIIAVQSLETDESIGYGQTFTAAKKTRVGIVACGYADGYPRHAPNGTPLAVAGKLTQIIGRVSMDMLYVDISDIPEAEIGAHVELWGSQVSVDDVAQTAGTISYELLCAVAPRVSIKVVG